MESFLSTWASGFKTELEQQITNSVGTRMQGMLHEFGQLQNRRFEGLEHDVTDLKRTQQGQADLLSKLTAQVADLQRRTCSAESMVPPTSAAIREEGWEDEGDLTLLRISTHQRALVSLSEVRVALDKVSRGAQIAQFEHGRRRLYLAYEQAAKKQSVHAGVRA